MPPNQESAMRCGEGIRKLFFSLFLGAKRHQKCSKFSRLPHQLTNKERATGGSWK